MDAGREECQPEPPRTHRKIRARPSLTLERANANGRYGSCGIRDQNLLVLDVTGGISNKRHGVRTAVLPAESDAMLPAELIWPNDVELKTPFGLPSLTLLKEGRGYRGSPSVHDDLLEWKECRTRSTHYL